MTTKLIGLNEYRTNLTQLWKDAQENNIKYIVVVHNKPVFEVKPLYNNIIETENSYSVEELKETEINDDLRNIIAETKMMDQSELVNI